MSDADVADAIILAGRLNLAQVANQHRDMTIAVCNATGVFKIQVEQGVYKVDTTMAISGRALVGAMDDRRRGHGVRCAGPSACCARSATSYSTSERRAAAIPQRYLATRQTKNKQSGLVQRIVATNPESVKWIKKVLRAIEPLMAEADRG
ncbi:hypothetical protein BDV95DRAFT_257813 [Massariosphaeria phaeospora]|uniref:Uncharacterized protein n=1 Tax=Massariosphaeria phaeospora TaxID=100035 RepID=A0A7C8M0S7_9PLEO|nr:hypothetical protein BDV95DRAFT_257813 [Massariosphaeria phaeospora]